MRKPPFIWRWFLIPLREYVWYPIKRWWHDFTAPCCDSQDVLCSPDCKCADCLYVKRLVDEMFEELRKRQESK